jgi:xylose isomerase
MSVFEPGAERKFAFGRGPIFGSVLMPDGRVAPVEPWELIYQLGDVGAWGVALHDDEIAPSGATPAELDDNLDKVSKALDSTGMVVSMTRTNLTGYPVFDHGTFTSVDREVRRYAIQKAMRGIDVGAELGAELHDLPAEGVSSVAARSPLDALDRYREAIDFLCGYICDQGYSTRLAIPAKSAARHGGPLIATIGRALCFVNTLDRPEMVGLNTGLAHQASPGGCHGVDQALAVGKLFNVELNAHAGHEPSPGFCSASVSDAFFLVKLLVETNYDGPLHFDLDVNYLGGAAGICDLVGGCTRTYGALVAKAKRFADDPEIRDALTECGATELAEPSVGPFCPDAGRALSVERFDALAMTSRRCRGQRLDQLVADLVLGLR